MGQEWKNGVLIENFTVIRMRVDSGLDWVAMEGRGQPQGLNR